MVGRWEGSISRTPSCAGTKDWKASCFFWPSFPHGVRAASSGQKQDSCRQATCSHPTESAAASGGGSCHGRCEEERGPAAACNRCCRARPLLSLPVPGCGLCVCVCAPRRSSSSGGAAVAASALFRGLTDKTGVLTTGTVGLSPCAEACFPLPQIQLCRFLPRCGVRDRLATCLCPLSIAPLLRHLARLAAKRVGAAAFIFALHHSCHLPTMIPTITCSCPSYKPTSGKHHVQSL